MALKRSTLVYYGLTDILAVRIVDVITDPLCGYLGACVVIWNYPITREKHAEVRAELDKLDSVRAAAV